MTGDKLQVTSDPERRDRLQVTSDKFRKLNDHALHGFSTCHLSLVTCHGFALLVACHLSLVALLLVGCGRLKGQALAVVNGQAITEQDLDARLKKLTPAYRQALGGDRRRLLEEMVLEALLLQEARKRGLERDPQVQELLREAKRQILIGRLLEREGREQVQVSDEEIAARYEENKAQFMIPERWRVSHVLVNTEAQAKGAVERLGKGEPFEQVARELSQDPSKTKGGDIGYFSRGQLIPEFEEACVQLKVGQTSGVVKTSLGFHVIRLVDHQAAQQRPLADVKDQMVRELRSQRERARVDQFLSQLRKQAHVFIREDVASPAPSPSASSSSPTNQP